MSFSSGVIQAENGLTQYTEIPSKYDRYELLRYKIADMEDQELLGLIIEYALDRNIRWQLYDIERRGEFHSFAQNLSLIIPGKQENQLTLIVPYVQSENSTRKNRALIAALLSILENDTPQFNIELYFLGSTDKNKGLYEYLDRIDSSSPNAVLYLSSHESLGNSVLLENGDSGHISPLGISKYISEQLAAHRIFMEQEGRTQLYRIGLPASIPISPLLESDINAIGILFLPHSGTPFISGKRSLDFLSALLLESLPETNAFSPDMNDRHHISIVLGNSQYFLGEQEYIIAVLVSSFLILLGLIFAVRKIRRLHLSTNQNITMGFLLVISTVFSLLIGYLLIALVYWMRGNENLAAYIPLPLISLKITGVGFSFLFFTQLLHDLAEKHIPRQQIRAFYQMATIALLTVDLIIFSSININFSHYFLWILSWMLLFFLIHNKTMKLLCFIVAVIPHIFITSLFHPFILTALAGTSFSINMMILIIIMPLAFIITGSEWLRNIDPRRRVLLFSLPIIITMAISLATPMFTIKRPQQVSITISTERQDTFFHADQQSAKTEGTSAQSSPTVPAMIRVQSDSALGTFSLDAFSQNISINTQRKESEFPVQNQRTILDYTGSKEILLGRSIYTFDFYSKDKNFDSIIAKMEISKNALVYNANLPYKIISPGNLQFLIGQDPPNPLRLQFVIPADSQPKLEIEVRYRIEDYSFISSDKPRDFTLIGSERIIFDSQPTSNINSTGNSNQ